MYFGVPTLSAQVSDSLYPFTPAPPPTHPFMLNDSLFQRDPDFRQDTIVRDTVIIDTVNSDSVQRRNAMFQDIIHYTSKDTMRISLNSQQVFFYGDADIKYTKTELKAEFIRIDMDKKEAFASGIADTSGNEKGSPKFKDGTQEFDSKELKYNFQTGKGFVKNIITQEGDGYIQGKLTKKMSDSVYCVKDGWYTTCDHHDHPHFYIRMKKAKMIKDKKVVAGLSYLVIEDVPLPLGVPFGFFPITKKGTSGVIMPTYGEERVRGFNLRGGGYYWAISDYIDVSVTGDIFSNGSWALGLISNYRKRYKYSGNLSFTISKNLSGEKKIPNDYQEVQDWSVKWTHTQDQKANPYSTFSASVDMSSSTNNSNTSNNINDFTNQRKQSSISWSKKWPDKPFSLSAGFTHNQNSRDTTISLSFPNANFKISTIYPLRKKNKTTNLKWYDNIGVSYNAELKNNVETKEYLLLKTSPKKWKNGFKHSIPISPSINLIKDVSFSPSINYSGVVNSSSIRKHWVDTSATQGYIKTDTLYGLSYAHNYKVSFSLGYNPTLYGMYVFKPDKKVSAIRHVLRPSISFSYNPKWGVDRDKYYREVFNKTQNTTERYSIYSSNLNMYRPDDTPEKDAGIVSLSLTNNLEMKVRNSRDTTGNEEFKKIKLIESFAISTSYDVFADSMAWSNIALSARTSLFEGKMNINLSGTLDPYRWIWSGGRATRIDKYYGGIGRLSAVSASTGMSFSSDNGSNKEKKNDLVGGFYDQYMDFDVPWSFSFDYTMSMSKTARPYSGKSKVDFKTNFTQTMRINGDVSLTPKWKFGFSSGYDFDSKQITATSFNITRDLHCWDMTFSCVPFGSHTSYHFQINVRSSLLQDLKLTKRESFYDNMW